MSVEDDDLSELERRMRAKLLAEPHRKPVQPAEVSQQLAGKPSQIGTLSDEEKRIAERIVGRDGLKKIENAKEGRRVYVAPVRVTYEWYWVPGDFSRMTIWRINRVENGRQRVKHKEGHLSDDLDEAIRDLRAKGYFVADTNLDRGRVRKAQPKVSARKAILNDLRHIRR